MSPQRLSGPGRSLRVVAADCLLVLASSAGGGGGGQKRSSATDLQPSPVKKVDRDKAAVVATLAAYAGSRRRHFAGSGSSHRWGGSAPWSPSPTPPGTAASWQPNGRRAW